MIDPISKEIEDEIANDLILELLFTMGVNSEKIRKSDIARIKVAGKRAMRVYIKKTYLK